MNKCGYPKCNSHCRHQPGLYLLFEVVLHAHTELVELIPLLGQTNGAVLRVAASSTQHANNRIKHSTSYRPNT